MWLKNINGKNFSIFFLSFFCFQVHQISADSFELTWEPEKIMKQIIQKLIQDGFVQEEQEDVYFFVGSEKIETNGQTLKGDTFQQYISFLLKIGLKIEKNWGFFKSKNDGVFYGVASQATIDILIEKYQSQASEKVAHKSSKPEEVKVQTTENKSIRSLHYLHEVWEVLSETLMRDQLINHKKDIHITIDQNQLWINGKELSIVQSKKYLSFLEDRGVEIETPQLQLHLKGKGNWTVKGNIHLNLN